MTLVIENLEKSFKGRPVVEGLNFHIAKGELVGLVGPNGAGKSTTLAMICGLLKPDAGHVFLDGLSPLKEGTEFKKRIAFVPERPGLYPDISALDFLKFSAESHNKPEQLAFEMAEKVGCAHVLSDPMATLSRGQRQALYLAAAFVAEPEVLILDEPTVGLDPIQQKRINEALKDYCKKGGAVLLSTHALYEAEHLCDRILVLMNHKILAEGKAAEIAKNHTSLYDFLHDAHLQVATASVDDKTDPVKANPVTPQK